VLCLTIIFIVGCKEEKTLVNDKIHASSFEGDTLEIDIRDSDFEITSNVLVTNKNKDVVENVTVYDNLFIANVPGRDVIISFDDEGNIVKVEELEKSVNITCLSKVSSNEVLFTDYKELDGETFIDIYSFVEGEMNRVFEWEKKSGDEFNKMIRKIAKFEDALFLFDYDRNLVRIENNEIEKYNIDDIKDICVRNNQLYILKDKQIDIMDIESNSLIRQVKLGEVSSDSISIDENGNISLIGDGAIYIQQENDSFSKTTVKADLTSDNIWAHSVLESKVLVSDFSGTLVFPLVKVGKNSNGSKETITIGVYDKYLKFGRAISRLDYDGITVEKNYYKGLSYFDYRTKLASEFLTDTAPDIVVFWKDDYVLDYVLSDSLADLKPLIEDDKDFTLDGYEKMMIDSFIENDRMYYFTAITSPYYIEYNKTLLNNLGYSDLDTLDLNEIYNIYISVNDDLDNPNYFIGFNEGDIPHYENSLMQSIYYPLFAGDINLFVDIENKKAKFDTNAFEQMIKKAKVLYNGYLNSPYSKSELNKFRRIPIKSEEVENHLFFTDVLQNGYYYLDVYKEDAIQLPIPIGFQTDSRSMLAGNALIAINAGTKNIDTTWEVYKKLVSYDAEYCYSTGVAGRTQMNYDSFGLLERSNDEKKELMKPIVSEYEGKSYEQIDEENAQIDNIFRSEYKMILQSKFDEIIKNELERYFLDEISVEELRTILQNKAELYLNE